ncbi:MAG: electron transport complex subunit RsxC [Treponema sp.]|jgi:electron transport complex protein RnfC|nr:electron transport complex subunit RsxC [Treponema sp.]
MAAKTFKRGLLLPTRKHVTAGKPTEAAPAPKQVVIPVNQHFGAPNKALVAPGDRVKQGQKIADALNPDTLAVPVHASIAGLVKKIEVRALSNNTDGLCVVIEADETGVAETGADETAFMPPLDINRCTKEEALGRIRDAGIIGMGGAGFPAHVKLSPPANKPVDVIIADGAECEPYLTTDEALINEKTRTLIQGLAIVMKITGVNRAIIGMEDNKAPLIPKIEKAAAEVPHPGTIETGLCKTRYPQGGEKLLITALTGREVPSGGLPMDAKCIVSNVGTLTAIAEAFSLGKPLIDRGLTVSGGACRTPKNIRAAIGTLVSDLIPGFIEIDQEKLRKILFGGPMMGTAVPFTAIPIQKNTSGVILMTEEETYTTAEGPCIRCGRCIRNCSCRLSPVLMNNALEAGDLDEAVWAGLMDCIECGACTYVCPARIRLVQRFRIGKGRLRAKQAAEAARRKAAEAAAVTTEKN